MGDLQTIDRALSEIYSLDEQGKSQEAQNKRRKTLQISEEAIRTAPSKEEKARIELRRGIIYNDLGQIATARRSFLLALASFVEIGDRRGEMDVYNALARTHFVRSEYDNAITYLEMCKALSEEIEFGKGKANAIVNLARIYMRKGELKAAEKIFLSGIQLDKELGNAINVSKDLRSLGYVYYLQRKFKEAKKQQEESYTIIQGKGLDRDEAVYHEYSGALATAQGDFASAHQHFYRVFEIMMPIAPKSDMISQTYRLLAELQIAEKDYDKALSSCEKGLKIAEKIKERIEIGAIHRAFGQIYSAKGDKQKAKEHFEKSISLLKEIKAEYELGLAYIEAGRSDAFDNDDRIVHLGNAKTIFKEIDVPYYVEMAKAFSEKTEKISKESSEPKDLGSALESKKELSQQKSLKYSPDKKAAGKYDRIPKKQEIVIYAPGSIFNIPLEASEVRDIKIFGDVGKMINVEGNYYEISSPQGRDNLIGNLIDQLDSPGIEKRIKEAEAQLKGFSAEQVKFLEEQFKQSVQKIFKERQKEIGFFDKVKAFSQRFSESTLSGVIGNAIWFVIQKFALPTM